jgi:Kef-type K+ transport system membrane component KefB
MFDTFSKIGIALLLFIIGLGMNVSELRKLGRIVVIVAMASLFSVGTLGFVVGTLSGYSRIEALIIGLTLFFSSTIIIVKILSDKKEQNRLHGQIAIGVILFDDVVATFALLFVAAGKSGNLSVSEVAILLRNGILLLGFLVLANTKLLRRITRSMATSQELLFLFAIAWGFGVASLFEIAGFSLEVGALFAGVALASSPYAQEIAARLKPLRDFFVVLFFIALGESLNVSNLRAALLPALLLSAIVILIKPLVTIAGMGLLGYTKRTSFKTGINLSQISEFSIVLVVVASSAGLVRQEISAIITLVAIITITTSTYLMQYDNKLFSLFDRVKFHLFEKEVVHKERRRRAGYQLILFGYHKGGHEFVKAFRDMGKRYIVIDYDPSVIDTLEHHDVPYMYGDATDLELLEEIGIESAKLIVSTFTDNDVTEQLVKHIRRLNERTVIVCHADNQEEAMRLYEYGATYVMIPHYIGSEKVSSFIRKNGLERDEFDHFREKHLSYLIQSHLELSKE